MFIVIQLLLILSLTTGMVQANRPGDGGTDRGIIVCSMGGWSAWSACSDACGNNGRQCRFVEGTNPSPTFSCRSCNRMCYNSGTPRAGYCDCPEEFWGKCCEHACASIDNCQMPVCTNGTNHQCTRCEHDYGGEKKAYRNASRDEHDNRVCEKICSWRSDSIFCFPGICSDVPSSCQCAPGFGSTNCLTINAKPNIINCLVTVHGSHGSNKANTDIHCESDMKTVVYTNIIPSVIRFDLESMFLGPRSTDYPMQYYINDFKVGITEATFTYTQERGGVRLNEKRVPCSGGSSQLRPHTGLLSCTKEYSLSNSTLRHTDRIHIKVYTKNGGYVKINNFDNGTTPSVSGPKYYTGQATVHSAELIIDLIKPFHCSVGYTCLDNMLDRGPPITKSTKLVVSWAGWSDSFSGIKQYHLMLYRMDVIDNKLSNSNVEPVINTTFNSDENIFNSTLSEPGVYAVLLAVEDRAGSKQVARRFFIFDDTSIISINTEDNKRLQVNSANKNTSYTWLPSLQDVNNTGEQVEVSWHGHFANVFQHNNKFLNGIAPNSPPIQAGYEELTGQPPDTVSRETIPNVNAIVRYDVSYAVDHLGGRSLNGPGRWTKVAAFQREATSIDIPRADGDSVRVWVKATDVMGNTKTDSVLVHVDSSPPVIQDVRPDRTHSAYEVDAYDFQSGLKEIHWKIRSSPDHGKVYDSGQMTARTRAKVPSDCFAPRCYCIPKNSECYLRNFGIKPDMSKLTHLHNQKDVDYELVVTVINNAMLTVTTVHAYNYTKVHTAELKGNTKERLPVAAIAGGSAAGVGVIAIATVAAICCLIKKSRTRKTHGESNTTESNKESDSEPPVYTTLNFNNPEYTKKTSGR